uniref:Uncharacterized protein n=1 Tax=Caulerpa lentillifera TaxID=148947 RepID=A0A2Z2QLF4_9CHLO|nr:hypothetical protein [Caulerpa lentillifera]AST24225.1 hypothetical protein [Caulerpa lentillifera]QKS32246.1 hypothetical protein [Caulerpa lentillifera]
MASPPAKSATPQGTRRRAATEGLCLATQTRKANNLPSGPPTFQSRNPKSFGKRVIALCAPKGLPCSFYTLSYSFQFGVWPLFTRRELGAHRLLCKETKVKAARY